MWWNTMSVNEKDTKAKNRTKIISPLIPLVEEEEGERREEGVERWRGRDDMFKHYYVLLLVDEGVAIECDVQ